MKLLRSARLRQIFVLTIVVGCFWAVISALYGFFADVCQGQVHVRYLCQQYRRGVISGSLCPKFCDRPDFTLGTCLSKDGPFSRFLWNHWEVYVNNVHLQHAKHVRGIAPAFGVPEQGRSMEEFKVMVGKFMENKLGPGDHAAIVDRAMDLADVNKDSKVSLAEAKTIWALLQYNQFFIQFIFTDCEHLPTLRGFCGDAFAVDYVSNRKLYTKDRSGISYWLFPNHHRWLFPYWSHRAKIAVGLLEFSMEAYQHGSEGTFHMCNMDESQVGYSDKYDVKIYNAADIISTKELVGKLEGRPCSGPQDCRYSDQCATECSKDGKLCTTTITRPSLFYICQMLEEYVLQDAPNELLQDMDRLLGRCSQLGKDDEKSQVEQSLILNDLKLLLWKHISYLST